MGPQDPKDVTRDTARDLSGLVGELAALKGDATHWLTDPEYAALRYRLEAALAAAGQRLYPLDLFAPLLINGGVAEVDAPVQARVRVVLVVISLISGSSVALLGPKTRGQVSDPAALARSSRLYVVSVWVTSSPFSVDHSAYKNALKICQTADALFLYACP